MTGELGERLVGRALPAVRLPSTEGGEVNPGGAYLQGVVRKASEAITDPWAHALGVPAHLKPRRRDSGV